jgi:hypothetical protein
MAVRRKILAKLILGAVISLKSAFAMSQPEFDLVIYPWVIEQTSGEFGFHNEENLENSLAQLASSLGEVKDLSKIYAQKENPVLNIKKALKSFLSVKQKDQKKGVLLIQPYMCRLKKDLIISTIIHRADARKLQSLAHTVLPFKRKYEKGELENALSKAYDKAAKKIRSKQNKGRHQPNNMKIKITDAKGDKRRLNSISPCLSYLLTEKAVEHSVTITHLGYDHYSIFKRSKLTPMNKPSRPTRQIIVDWYQDHDKEYDYSFKAWKAESVFGQHIKNVMKHKFELSLEDSQFDIPNNLDFISYIDEESKSLKMDEMPVISKIYRAWSYVDKGRAWGLKIGDRLITEDSEGEQIKGHVVGFYGPEHEIVSPRGYKVNEGAIVYIRKGQAKTKIGQSLKWDKRKYPTPWPPKEDM